VHTLGHEEHGIAPIGDRAPHPPLALALVILPGVVEKVNAGIDRLVNDAHRFGNGASLAEVITTESHDRDEVLTFTKRQVRNGFSGHGRDSSRPVRLFG
jgi:hypothetical protein